jgi:hypothetical protein
VTETPAGAALSVGQTVRWAPELARDWHEGRAADDQRPHEGGGVGRITARYDDDGYCALCEYHGRQCPGPWYAVDFGQGESGGFGGLYAGHELAAA